MPERNMRNRMPERGDGLEEILSYIRSDAGSEPMDEIVDYISGRRAGDINIKTRRGCRNG